MSAVEIVQLDEANYGSLETEKLARVRSLLLDKCMRLEPAWLLINFSRVDFVGAGFVGILVEAWDQLQQRGRRLALCGLTPYCAGLIRRLHLDKLFPIYSTRRSALSAIHGETHDAEVTAERSGIRVQESEVKWDSSLVRLEYIGDDDVPLRCVIVPRGEAPRED